MFCSYVCILFTRINLSEIFVTIICHFRSCVPMSREDSETSGWWKWSQSLFKILMLFFVFRWLGSQYSSWSYVTCWSFMNTVTKWQLAPYLCTSFVVDKDINPACWMSSCNKKDFSHQIKGQNRGKEKCLSENLSHGMKADRRSWKLMLFTSYLGSVLIMCM